MKRIGGLMAMSASVILLAAAPATRLQLTPWHAANLPTTTSAAVKYLLTVRGVPHAHVHLRARYVAKGWIAAFCTQKVCSPDQTMLDLNAKGTSAIEFELIRNDSTASHSTGATVVSDDGAWVVVTGVTR
jgi:hypothetical protein